MRAPGPLRHDGATMTCALCGARFVASGRRRYCGDACRAMAWRRRHQPSSSPVVVPAGTARRQVTVYECPDCEARLVGEQRCGDCGVFARRAGLGGRCPHCDEPVTVAELVGHELIIDRGNRA